MASREAALDRHSGPPVTAEFVAEYADKNGVCVRPLLRLVTDVETGESEQVAIPCGSTRESRCRPCAEKTRRLRMQQCRDGWHLVEDPLEESAGPGRDSSTEDQVGGRGRARQARSTRRRPELPDLPRLPAESRSVGRTFAAPTGKSYRPSMFVTLTVPSFGRVVTRRGYPQSPERYDYRRAAIYALAFPRLFDRWMQNLRRCAGYRVQYFGAIEAQRRLAPHIHLAIRGAIPRRVLRAVTDATYLQLWWPAFDEPVYVEDLPWWDQAHGCYRDPAEGTRLPTWEEAVEALDEPAATLTFGRQMDVQGIIAEEGDADRRVRYLTKYLTKSIADTYLEEGYDAARADHVDRLHEEVLYLPCSPECANWLRFGIEPRHPGPGLQPGWCVSKAHDRENLGLGGRRVQVSRHWSGKTLREHRADRAAVVREVLAEAGVEMPDAERMAADVAGEDGRPRFNWEPVPVATADYVTVVMTLVQEQQRWRREYDAAKARLHDRARAGPSRAHVDRRSATTTARARQVSPATTVTPPTDSQQSPSDDSTVIRRAAAVLAANTRRNE